MGRLKNDAERVAQNSTALSDMITSSIKSEMKPIPYELIQFGAYKKYNIDQDEVIDLAHSLAALGLEQNLVVKDNGNGTYTIVTGHKRLTAINYLMQFKNQIDLSPAVMNSICFPMSLVISGTEEHLITNLRMHETNMQARSGFTFEEIEDYYKTIEEINKKGLLVNGQKIHGKMRSILAEKLNVSEGTAKKFIAVIKSDDDELLKKLRSNEISVNKAYNVLNGNDDLEGGKVATLAKPSTKKAKKKEDELYLPSDFENDLIKSYNSFYDTLRKAKNRKGLSEKIIKFKGKEVNVEKFIQEDLDELLKTFANIIDSMDTN